MRYDHFSMLPERAFSPVGKRMTLEGGGKGSAPAAPDYGPIAIANEKAALYAKQSADADLAFRKDVYNQNLPRVQQLVDMANQVSGKQLSMMDYNNQIARQNNDYYNNSFKPIEQQTIMDSMGSQYMNGADQGMLASILNGTSGLTGNDRTLAVNRLTQNSQNNAANQAMQVAQAQSNSAYNQQAQNLARMGLDPSRLASAAAGLAQNQTLANVGAANTARTNAFAQQQGLRGGVANFGRNMANTAAQSFGLAGTMGNNAVGNANSGAMAGLPYAQYASGGTGNQIGAANSAIQGNLGIGGLMAQNYNTQMNAYANQGDFLGGLMGLGSSLGSAYIMRGSDRAIKDNIVRIGTLDNGLHVYSFTYKPKYQDMYGKGQQFGVMADEVEKLMPEAVATHPDGHKMVNYGMIGASYGI